MNDEQATRLIEIALREREAMAEKIAVLILNSPIEGFIPEIAKADFMAWCAKNG